MCSSPSPCVGGSAGVGMFYPIGAIRSSSKTDIERVQAHMHATTIREHINFLEQQINDLSDKSMEDSLLKDDRNRIESEIRAAKLALAYYRKALELEKRLSARKQSVQMALLFEE